MTDALPSSYLKFDYGLRPSKQVERKIIIEVLLRLAQELEEVRIQDYVYLGFGSPFYVDFVLFHKYLHIDKMICVEGSPIPKRMKFNKPYEFIQLRMKLFSQVLPDLDRDMPHLLWLDFDTSLSEEHLHDIEGAVNSLAPGSVIIVTLDAEVRIPADLDLPEYSEDEKLDATLEHYQGAFGSRLDRDVERADISRAGIPQLFTTVVRNTISEACRLREWAFGQLINVRYADGAQMISVGGIIGRPELIGRVRDTSVFDLSFVQGGADLSTISVPPLTVRERLWLEQNLEADPAFELGDDMLENFRRLYKYYPSYTEALL